MLASNRTRKGFFIWRLVTHKEEIDGSSKNIYEEVQSILKFDPSMSSKYK